MGSSVAGAHRIQRGLLQEGRQSPLTSHAEVAAQPGTAPDVPGPKRPLAVPSPTPLVARDLQGVAVDGVLPAAVPHPSAQSPSGQISPTSSLHPVPEQATEERPYPSTEQRHVAPGVLWSRQEVVCSQPAGVPKVPMDVPRQMLQHSTPPRPCQSQTVTSGVSRGAGATRGVPRDTLRSTSSLVPLPSSPEPSLPPAPACCAETEAPCEFSSHTSAAVELHRPEVPGKRKEAHAAYRAFRCPADHGPQPYLDLGSASTTASEESDGFSEDGASVPRRRSAGEVTLVLRRIPARFSQERLLQELPPDGLYNFLCMPYSLKQRRPASYAFVNCISQAAAELFVRQWRGRCLHADRGQCVADIRLARVQGFRANVLQHRHLAKLKEACHPAVFSGAVRLDFTELLRQLDFGPLDTEGSHNTGSR
mmetsp:Transcript_77825/g.241757  ORF Transcript_77825/g.241757 Transcript_77825/m.241757 type:complete len:421 (+) Transcript_77825:3-1265(+)